MNIWHGLKSIMGGGSTAQKRGSQSSAPGSKNQEPAIHIDEDTALQVSAYFAAVRLRVETFSCLPVKIYDVSKGFNEAVPASDHNLRILAASPNSRQTPMEFFETMELNLVMHGNAYARISRDGSGKIISLWPLASKQVDTRLLDDGSVVHYYYIDNDVVAYSDESILHVKLMGNGLIGLSPLEYASNCLGIASAVDNYAGKKFRNQGRPSGVLYTDQALQKKQREQVRETFADIVEEKEESKRLLVLPLSFKYQSTEASPADMQMLERGKFSVEEIARFVGVPSILINHSTGSTWGSGIEQIMTGYYRVSQRPSLTRWEQALERKIYSLADRTKYEIKFDFESSLRGDSKTQMEVLGGYTGGPLMTPNEGRKRLHLPPTLDGDKLNPAPSVGQKASEIKKDEK